MVNVGPSALVSENQLDRVCSSYQVYVDQFGVLCDSECSVGVSYAARKGVKSKTGAASYAKVAPTVCVDEIVSWRNHHVVHKELTWPIAIV